MDNIEREGPRDGIFEVQRSFDATALAEKLSRTRGALTDGPALVGPRCAAFVLGKRQLPLEDLLRCTPAAPPCPLRASPSDRQPAQRGAAARVCFFFAQRCRLPRLWRRWRRWRCWRRAVVFSSHSGAGFRGGGGGGG